VSVAASIRSAEADPCYEPKGRPTLRTQRPVFATEHFVDSELMFGMCHCCASSVLIPRKVIVLYCKLTFSDVLLTIRVVYKI
jgi:hypothetical protein